MISAHQLTKRFGRVLAVDHVDFDIPRGEVTGFLGPNGAGKTTTIRMIAGYLTPTHGWVKIDGREMTPDAHQLRGLIGYLPESAPLYTEMRVSEYLHWRGRVNGMRRAERTPAIGRVLSRCWLDAVRRRPINQLSKGYRQRVGLAAALLPSPAILILDEPTVGLDPSQIRETRSLIRELAGEHTVLLSSHILPEVQRTCDGLVMIAHGRIVAEGTLADLSRRMAGRAVYEIETDAQEAVRALSLTTGVKDVASEKIDDRWYRFTVKAEDDAPDLREPLAQTLATLDGTTRQLVQRDASLEQLFLDLVATADQNRDTADTPDLTPDHAEAAA